MIVHFGRHLDGMQPAPPATAAGEVALGPARALEMLELQLGLPPSRARPGEALLAYRGCLAELDGGARFYHRSFAADPIGVARTLLAWRARWYEAGWRGEFGGAVSGRLRDMAEVERIARERVPPTPGQRLQRVGDALEHGLLTQIERIVLHDERTALPAAWRAVLAHFDCRPAPGIRLAARAPAGIDLGRVQRALLAFASGEAGEAARPVELAGDESLVVVRGVSRDLSAQALAEFLRRLDAPDETVVIAERDGIIFDNALERVGLARAGFRHFSRFRAVSQVLKLCLGLVWDPISPQLLLQFLLHPVGPLPRWVRAMLADAASAQPGVGGQAWTQALAKIAVREEQRQEGPGAGANADEARTHASGEAGPKSSRVDREARVERLLADIRYWLDSDRYPAAAGAPLGVLTERALRCTTWLLRRLHDVAEEQRSLYAAAAAQAEALAATLAGLADLGEPRIGRIALEQLVDEVTSDSADPASFAQAGHVRATTAPEAITEPWSTVIWWDVGPQGLRAEHAWSAAELAELAAEGVDLPTAEAEIRERGRAWMRPVLNARSRLILVIHDRDEGRHPLWSQLTSAARGFNEVRIEDELLQAGHRAVIPGLDVATERLARRPLPGRRRWWKLPADCALAVGPKESYTSLRLLIDYPHEWALRHGARLSTGRATNFARDALLYGNLAHRLIELYFESFPAGPAAGFEAGTEPAWAANDEAAVRRFVAATLPAIIADEGAVLMEPGMGVVREQVASTLENALLQLLRHLRQAGIRSVEAERAYEVPFQHIVLRGAIDLLLKDRRGRETVLDVKWGGEDRRGRELAANRSLQLATYAYMRRTAITGLAAPGRGPAARREAVHGSRSEAPWPAQAYFIVTTGNVLAQDTEVFPEALPFPPAFDEHAAEVWARVVASFEWRCAQLATGDIEVNAAGMEPDERSTPPDNALAAEAEPDPFDVYATLTGWEPGE